MKTYRIPKSSERGRLIKECDKLLSEVLKQERGPNCEIHNKICDRVGNMHLFSKQAHPKLRFVKENIIRCGWFCGHFWTHHNPDDPRALYVKQRIIELRGETYLTDLLNIERYMGKHDKLYLLGLRQLFKKELK